MKKVSYILFMQVFFFLFTANDFAQPVNSPDYPLTLEPDIAQYNPSIFVNPWQEGQILNADVNHNVYHQGNVYVWELTNAQSIKSLNSGQTWIVEELNGKALPSGYPTPQINRYGRFFVGYTDDEHNQISCWSDNQGATWHDVIIKQDPSSGLKSLMQNHLWVDNSERSMYEGNVYAVWRYVGTETQYYSVEFSRSEDDGETWENSRVLTPSAPQGNMDEQWPVVQTGPFGEVYVCWSEQEFASGGPQPETAIGFTRSFDGGNTFDDNYIIRENIKGTSGYATLKNIRLNSAPAMTVDISGGPYDGRIYVVWSNIGEPGINTGQDIDIYMITSDDNGETWSAPVKVNQDASGLGKEHLFPAVTCDPETGTVTVIYYDDRNVSSDMVEVYASISYDGGGSFMDFRISDISLDFDNLISISSDMLTNKIGVSASHGRVYPVWTDFREGTCRTVTSPFDEKPFLKPRDLTAEIVDDNTGTVALNWEMDNTSGLLYFRVFRNNEPIQTTLDTEYSEDLPAKGNYTYRVTAKFADGESSPETAFVSWGTATFSTGTDQLDVALEPGDETTRLMKLTNGGDVPLTYNITCRHDPAATPSKDGGPDTFGYFWKDNNDPGGPVFDYIDISQTGIEITGISNDNYVGPYMMGFSFPFYDEYYDEFYVSSNGLITFGGSFATPVNSPIPIADGNNNFIAWCWDDLQVKTGGQVFYEQFEDFTVIQFKDYAQNGTLTVRYTIDAEVILYKNGNIRIQYLNHTPTLFVTNSCTVGIENKTGSDGLQVVYDAFYIEDGLAVEFYNPGVNWLNFSSLYGTVEPGKEEVLYVGFSSTGYTVGDYYGKIVFTTNAPEQLQYIIPAHMTVSEDVPAAPGNLQGQLNSGEINFNWDAPAGKNLLGYNLYDINEKVNTSLIGATQFTLTNPGNGSHYFYVTAVYSDGESNPGNIVQIDIEGPLQQSYQIGSGWSGISSYLNPLDTDPESIFDPIMGNLVILCGSEGVFWPGENVNTLGNWDFMQGYKIKLTQASAFNIQGSEITQNSMSLPVGWSIIPVWSSCPQNVEEVVSYEGNALTIVKEVAGPGVYWPVLGINTLQTLMPGKAYELKSEDNVYLNFQDCGDGVIPVKNSEEIETRWNKVTQTGISHAIAVSAEAGENLCSGDVIGAFNSDGLCTGVVLYEMSATALVVYGDDVSTDVTDGMLEGEAITFKLYRPSENKVCNLSARFDETLPQQEYFTTNGMSALIALTPSLLGVGNTEGQAGISVSPNPSNGKINILLEGKTASAKIMVTDIHGQVIMEEQSVNPGESRLSYDLTAFPAGIYFITVTDNQNVMTAKFVISN